MLERFIKRHVVFLFIVALCGWAVLQAAPADAQSTSYIEGQKLYAAKQYKKALGAFQVCMNEGFAKDASVHYYMGACYHQLRDINSAKECYTNAIKYGVSQAPAVNALTALMSIDMAYAKSVVPAWNWKLQNMLPGHGRFGNDGAGASPTAGTTGVQNIGSTSRAASSVTTYGSSGSSSGGSSSFSSSSSNLPLEGKFDIGENPFGNGMVYLRDASINGRRIDLVLFDTGAEMVLFGKNQLQQYGMSPPSGPPVTEVRGVGGVQKAWKMKVDLKVGNIERRNFEIFVQESFNAPPLLGQSFFREYQYNIDKQQKVVRLVRADARPKTTASSTAGSQYSVPFTKQGNLLVVQVQINGRTLPMCMDTGASNTQFAEDQLKLANLTVPHDAQAGSAAGIGGVSKTLIFPVNRIKMGPIDKADFPVQVVSKASMPYPLLGQDFFGDWRFSIDNANNIINFHSRGSN